MIRKLMTLILGLIIAIFSNQANAQASSSIPKVTVKEYIVKHSMEMGVDPALALSIAKLESNFCHEKKSPYGAVGVFQLMPSTAKKLGYNPWYVNENIKGGLTYYKMMYKQFGSTELALAAYNAGPANVAKYKGIPPFKETKFFVSTIMAEYNKQKVNPDPIINEVKNKNSSTKIEINKQPKQEEIKVEKENIVPTTPIGGNILSMFVGLENSSIE